ncbi:MAG: hypothetical protein M1816_003068 [Peltula sp. TS41687]|nr:MAG: hypothetical protein M1816_003068 [Peltula sp. TS41687]
MSPAATKTKALPAPPKPPSKGSYEDAHEYIAKLLQRAREENSTGLLVEEEADFLPSWRGDVDTLKDMRTDVAWVQYGNTGLVVKSLISKQELRLDIPVLFPILIALVALALVYIGPGIPDKRLGDVTYLVGAIFTVASILLFYLSGNLF